VEPGGERRPEWWIAHRLLQAMGRPSLFDGLAHGEEPDPWSKWRHMLERGSGLSLADLQADPSPRELPPPLPGTFFADQVHTADGLVDCCPPSFSAALERCHAMFVEGLDGAARRDGGELLLIHKRDAWMHNSWFANLERMKRNGRTANPLGMCAYDAGRLGLDAGTSVRISSAHGEIESVVEIDDDLMHGVVSMVHGWGHRASPRLRVASSAPGSNPNALLPTGPGSFEPLSSQAHMTGIAVRVRALAAV
jgi:formate dehydrogenase